MQEVERIHIDKPSSRILRNMYFKNASINLYGTFRPSPAPFQQKFGDRMHVCSFDLLNFTNVGEKRVFAWSYHWIKSVDFMEPGEFCNLSLLFYFVNTSLLYHYINTSLLLQTTVNYATNP